MDDAMGTTGTTTGSVALPLISSLIAIPLLMYLPHTILTYDMS